jgi:hypothetical protein
MSSPYLVEQMLFTEFVYKIFSTGTSLQKPWNAIARNTTAQLTLTPRITILLVDTRIRSLAGIAYPAQEMSTQTGTCATCPKPSDGCLRCLESCKRYSAVSTSRLRCIRGSSIQICVVRHFYCYTFKNCIFRRISGTNVHPVIQLIILHR